MIPQQKKNKIFDIVMCEYDFHLIKHRIINVYNYVHKIIIVKTSDQKKNKKIYVDCLPWIDKIVFLDDETSESFKEDYDFKHLFVVLNEYNVFFEDLICFSNCAEIPNYSDFEIVVEHLTFEPVILRMVDFVHNLKIHCKNKHLGTFCLNFGNLLSDSNILKKLIVSKRKLISNDLYVVDNGYNFSFFPFENDTNLYTFTTNIHPKCFGDENKNYLTDFEESVSFNSQYLFQKNFYKKIANETLIVINHQQRKIENSWVEKYDRVFNFNFSKDFTYPEIKILNKIYDLNIFVPPYKFYQTDGDFYETFFYLEVHKKLQGLNLMNNQNLDLLHYHESFEMNTKKTYYWSQIKNEYKLLIK